MIMELIHLGVPIIISILESVSIVTFAWSQIFSVYPVASLFSVSSCACILWFSANRNSTKISDLLNPKKTETPSVQLTPLGLFNILLAVFIACVSTVRKFFTLSVFLAKSSLPFQLDNLLLYGVLSVYASYTAGNTLADLQRAAKYFIYDGTNIYFHFYSIVVNEKSSVFERCVKLLVYLLIIYCAFVSCKLKMLGTLYSLVSLANRHGGIYNTLNVFSYLMYWPIVSIALMNAKRCLEETISVYNGLTKHLSIWDALFLCMITMASYITAISNKSLSLTSNAKSQAVPALMVHFSANVMRQSGRRFDCHPINEQQRAHKRD